MRGHRRSDLAHAVSLTIGRDRKLEGDYVEDDEARSLTPDGRGKAGRSRQSGWYYKAVIIPQSDF